MATAQSPLNIFSAPIVDTAGIVLEQFLKFIKNLLPVSTADLTSSPPGNAILRWNGTQVVGGSDLVYSIAGLSLGNSINFPNGGAITVQIGGVGTQYDYSAMTQQMFNFPVTDSNGAGVTLPASEMLCGALLRTGPGAAFTDIGATHTQLVQGTLNNQAGGSLLNIGQPWLAINGTGFAWTLQPPTLGNVNFFGNLSAGNFVIPANSARSFFLMVNRGTTVSQLWG